MKRAAAALVVMTLAAPAGAQQEESEGFDLMKEGARMLFRGLIQQMEPAVDDLQSFAEEMRPAMRDFAEQMGPALRDLMDEVEDWSVYAPPEMLPNGDIIIRRKPEAPGEDGLPEDEGTTPPGDGEIDL